jgi:hypothetical protein
LGALHTLAVGKQLTAQQAKTVANKAIMVASKFDPYTGAPFQAFMQERDSKK